MSEKIITTNRQAYHEYFIEDEYEAGLVLSGSEIKSIRKQHVQLKQAYITIKNGEAYIVGMNISGYEYGSYFNDDPLRTRKLLLHLHEINKLSKKMILQGYTIVPLRLKLKNGLAKLDIALAKGKHLYDKRECEKQKTIQRDIDKRLKYR